MYSTELLNLNRPLNSLVFESYLRGDSENETLNIYYANKDSFPAPKEYCLPYIKHLLKQFNKEKVLRKIGYKKLDDPVLVVLFRFIQNNGIWAFLPQRKIAEVLGVNQKTVSRYLQKMIKDGIICVVKKYHYSVQMAHEYILTPKGIAIVAKLLKGYKKESFLSKEKSFDKVNLQWLKEKTKVIKIAAADGYSYAVGKVADLYEETMRKAKLAQEAYIKLHMNKGE